MSDGVGTALGQKDLTFPGLAPVSKKVAALQSEVAELEAAKWELEHVRATLMLNFPTAVRGATGGTTSAMLMAVLESLIQGQGAAAPGAALPVTTLPAVGGGGEK